MAYKKQMNDMDFEGLALKQATTAMLDSIRDCPLSDSLKVYAALHAALTLCDEEHVDEVLQEIRSAPTLEKLAMKFKIAEVLAAGLQKN